MKKMIMAMAIITFTFGNGVFAGEKEIDKRVQQAFEKEFAGATDVHWYEYPEFIKVSFTYDDLYLIACYNSDGEKLALIRNILVSVLPLKLQINFKAEYQDYWVSLLYELSDKNGTQYNLTLENAQRIVYLRSDGNHNWQVVRKVKNE
jgi:hypothetical protein